MPITVKLNRGPAKGRHLVMDDSKGIQDVILYAEGPTRIAIEDPLKVEFVPVFIKHEYRRSNRRLANGTWIYEWMGIR